MYFRNFVLFCNCFCFRWLFLLFCCFHCIFCCLFWKCVCVCLSGQNTICMQWFVDCARCFGYPSSKSFYQRRNMVHLQEKWPVYQRECIRKMLVYWNCWRMVFLSRIKIMHPSSCIEANPIIAFIPIFWLCYQ